MNLITYFNNDNKSIFCELDNSHSLYYKYMIDNYKYCNVVEDSRNEKYNIKTFEDFTYKFCEVLNYEESDFYDCNPKVMYVLTKIRCDGPGLYSPYCIQSFYKKEMLHLFLEDLKLNLYNNGYVSCKLRIDELSKSISELMRECFDLLTKIKTENEPILKLNLQNEFNGKLDLKNELLKEKENLETKIKSGTFSNKNLTKNFPTFNYIQMIESNLIKSIEDVEILEVPFERIA